MKNYRPPKPITINGVYYPSETVAARALGVSPKTVAKRRAQIEEQPDSGSTLSWEFLYERIR